MKKSPDKKNKQLTEENSGYDSWFSLIDALLKPGVSVATLTTFIENNDIKALDQVDRIITATDGGEQESTSKARALNLLAFYFAELRDCDELPPGAHPDVDPGRWLEWGSPLIRFGWTKNEVPDDPDDFAKWIANSLPESKKPSSSQNRDPNDWKEQARQIADECYDSDTRNNCRDSLKGYASRVMDKMRKREIYAPHGPIDNPNTVMRDALQADKWWRKKKPITYGKRGISGKRI